MCGTLKVYVGVQAKLDSATRVRGYEKRNEILTVSQQRHRDRQRDRHKESEAANGEGIQERKRRQKNRRNIKSTKRHFSCFLFLLFLFLLFLQVTVMTSRDSVIMGLHKTWKPECQLKCSPNYLTLMALVSERQLHSRT